MYFSFYIYYFVATYKVKKLNNKLIQHPVSYQCCSPTKNMKVVISWLCMLVFVLKWKSSLAIIEDGYQSYEVKLPGSQYYEKVSNFYINTYIL